MSFPKLSWISGAVAGATAYEDYYVVWYFTNLIYVLEWLYDDILLEIYIF